jgi:hypothetical protein
MGSPRSLGAARRGCHLSPVPTRTRLHAHGGDLMATRHCEICGTPFTTTRMRVERGYGRWCSRACFGEAKRRGPHTGRYVAVNCGTHSEWEHRRIAEMALGKPLPSAAIVHHVDGDGRNNMNRNLVICQDQAYHLLLEQRTRIVRAGGNLNRDAWICGACKRPLPATHFSIRTRGKQAGYKAGVCRDCASTRYREWRQKKQQEAHHGL